MTAHVPGPPVEVRISLESTGEVSYAPAPARLWRGRTDDGLEVLAWVTLVVSADRGTPPEVRRRTQAALETRIRSTAVIWIPLGHEHASGQEGGGR